MKRRNFLQNGVASLAASAVGGRAFVGGQRKPKRVGLIGCGWYGKNDLFRLIQVTDVDVVSLCDVDKQMLTGAGEMVAARQVSKKVPRLYGDWRTLLKERDLDIVIIGTPDHWHALPMIEAVKAGADVYVQKPVSVDVIEGQAMVAAARKYKKVVKLGAQRRSPLHSWARSGSSKAAAPTICGAWATRPTRRRPLTSTTRCGPAPRHCGRSTRCFTRSGGGTFRSSATGLWATCACTCSTWFGGCWDWAGPSGSAQPAAFW